MPFTSPRYLLYPGIEPASPALQVDSLLLSHWESPTSTMGTKYLSRIANALLPMKILKNMDKLILKSILKKNQFYYLTIKRNEVPVHIKTMKHLKNIMLSEWSKSQKMVYYMIPFTWNGKNWKIHTNKIRNCQGSGEGKTLEWPLTYFSQPESLFTWLKRW